MVATVGDPRDNSQDSPYLPYYTSVYPYGTGPAAVTGSTSAPTITDPRDGTAGVT